MRYAALVFLNGGFRLDVALYALCYFSAPLLPNTHCGRSFFQCVDDLGILEMRKIQLLADERLEIELADLKKKPEMEAPTAPS